MDKKENSQISCIRDIAKLANVSKSTVARALNNEQGISAKTRQKILNIAEEYNYKDNSIFSFVASQSYSKKLSEYLIPIALLYGDISINLEKHLDENIQKFGFHLEKVLVDSKTTPEDIEQQLAELGIVGVLIYSVDSVILKSLDLASYSVFSLHRGRGIEQLFSCVRPDHFNNMFLAWEKAISYGHVRIGAAIGKQPYSSHDDELRYGAVADCQHMWKDKIEIIPPYVGYPKDFEKYLEWFHTYRPSCIIGTQVNFYWALTKEGVKVPQDVSFISLIRNIESKEISGLNNLNKDIVLVALSQLDMLIRRRYHGMPENPISIYLSSLWHEGETLISI